MRNKLFFALLVIGVCLMQSPHSAHAQTPTIPYYAKSITLTTSGTVYNIQTLLGSTAPTTGREVLVQNDTSVNGNIFVGGNSTSAGGVVSSSNHGYKLASGDSRTYRGAFGIPVSSLYVVADTNSMVLNVEIVQ